MNDNDLLAISELLDKKLKPVYQKMDQTDKKIEHIQLLIETNVIPRLQQIESCYTDTYDRL